MSQAPPIARRPQHDIEELLESSFSTRERRLPRRELTFELALTALMALVSIGLVVLFADGVRPSGPVVALVAAYAVASRVAYPLGAGNLVPTQPFLVALFVLAPPALVPLLVLIGLAVGTLGDALMRRTHPERLSFSGGDAVHSLGPALVFVIAGADQPLEAGWPLACAAFATQLVFDLGSQTVREWVAGGVRPIQQFRVAAQVWTADFCLTPLGLMAASALDESGWAPLGLVPLVALLQFTAQDRLDGFARAHARLVDLQRERRRLQLAVQRIGEAFASNLDFDALLQIVTRAGVEALDGASGRASSYPGRGRRLLRRATVTETVALAPLLDAAEIRALQVDGVVVVDSGADVSIACRIAADDTVYGTVAVARSGAPFAEDELGLLAYLCEQAAVAAGNVLRHEALHHQALTDELTTLANHRRFQELLGATVERHRESGTPGALVLFDLDNFKSINDVHGHQTGDRVLRTVGRCLRDLCRGSDEPARYGGEELGVVLAGASLATAAEHAERIRQAIEALELTGAGGEPLVVTVSAGVAALGNGVRTKADLLGAADDALYRAKRTGKNRVELGTAPLRPAAEAPRQPAARDTPEADLRAALAQDELFLEYQPLVRLSQARTVAVEALVRWRHPQRGVLAPADFVPFAERNGLIVALGRWVLEEACRQGTVWTQRWPDLSISVNVSASQLAAGDLPDCVARALRTTGLPAANLTLELTETVRIQDLGAAADQLAALRSLGCRIAVDDFGTAHASLEHLQNLPLDVLKIPRTYIDGIDSTEAERSLGHGIIELARRLELLVVAEGIERPGQLTHLKEFGCDLGQGFLLARPLEAQQIESLLAEEDRIPAGVTDAWAPAPAA